MKTALAFGLSLVLSVSAFAQVRNRAPKEGATPTRTVVEAPSTITMTMTVDLVQIEPTPDELERLLGALDITAAQRAELLRSENQTEIAGPVTILQPVASSKAAAAKQARTSLLSATNAMLYDDGVEQGDPKSNGLYGLDAGSEVFPGDRVVFGILVNPGPSIAVLQTNSGETITLDPGELVHITGCVTACATTCSSGAYSCCGLDNSGCARCACVNPEGPFPPWQCQSGGPGSTGCSIAAN